MIRRDGHTAGYLLTCDTCKTGPIPVKTNRDDDRFEMFDRITRAGWSIGGKKDNCPRCKAKAAEQGTEASKPARKRATRR